MGNLKKLLPSKLINIFYNNNYRLIIKNYGCKIYFLI